MIYAYFAAKLNFLVESSKKKAKLFMDKVEKHSYLHRVFEIGSPYNQN